MTKYLYLSDDFNDSKGVEDLIKDSIRIDYNFDYHHWNKENDSAKVKYWLVIEAGA